MADREPTGRLYLGALVVGILAGLIAAALHAVLDQAEQGRALLRTTLVDELIPGWLLLSIAGALVLIAAAWLIQRFAPETAGSGIPDVESTLAGGPAIRWQRVLPVKFIAATLALGAGATLGREGPSIHLGAAVGQMVTNIGRLGAGQGRTLIAAGAAAGLAAAINAPLAAIVFITEEWREHFRYSFSAIQSVILACALAVIVSGWALGQGPALPIQHLGTAPLATLPLFLALGLLIGVLGVAFNRLLLGSMQVFRLLRRHYPYTTAALLGLSLGPLLWWAPQTLGGGEDLIESLLGSPIGLLPLVILLIARLLMTAGSAGLGLPGGVLVPLLALGTIVGAIFDQILIPLAPGLNLTPGVFAVAAMGALLAATIRAPLTGILMVIEMTGALSLALPIVMTCLVATFTAETLGGRPLYNLMLEQARHPPARLRWPALRVMLGGVILAALVLMSHT